ncbi:MAG: glutamate-5-semialdehyde dehydrogenase [Victivallales bacterium]|nr:glutamate-5-semialdehyde dehydrogenase [Victivallales bacterium]
MDSRNNTPSIPAMSLAAKQSLSALASASGMARQTALNRMAEKLLEVKTELFAANAEDLAAAPGLSPAFQKRLQITEKIFDYMLKRLREAAALPDPVGRVLEGRTMPSGLQVSRVAVPIGVIAIIYEARPNVTTDAAAVALKSGNAVILKGGSESIRTNRVLARAMREALMEASLPADAVQLIERTDHDAVRELLQQDQYVDLVIPRGGKQLIRAVAEGTRIPVLKHYDGICHQYVAADADEAMAVALIVNSKCQRVEVCNALETLLVDAACAMRLLPPIAAALREQGVELRGCEETRQIAPGCLPATEADWDTEYLAPILSIKVVHGIDEAIDHIAKHGSGHTDGIITNSLELARRFTCAVDSASVLVNASTRLSGGGDYGMGAVVGISTDRLHARGPVGPAELCTYKWIAIGNGTLRE